MTKHSHESTHAHHGGGHSHERADTAVRRRVWRNWIWLIAVLLMLVAMAIYVLSLDEAIEPEGEVQPAVPAATN